MEQRQVVSVSTEELHAYSLGKCEPERAEVIEAILAGLPDYSSILATAPEDAVVRHLRGAAELPAADTVRPSVPGYDILAELGRGGTGVVYKARHLALNRLVALKMVLAGSHAGPIALVRFRQEAETVARLQHPNIVQVYEVGSHNGLPYLALEFVEGGTMAQKTAGVAQHPREAAGLVELLVRAVEYAHQNGIIHRDVKPANVLLTPAGAPKLSDFGLARRTSDVQGMTATGAILGTPGYLAPEQAGVRGTAVGPPTDVYGLGAVLYYLLTGRPPIQAASAADVIRQTLEGEPTRPAQLRPGLPRDLETICLKCLQKEPAQRYAGAAALADDLRRFLADEPIAARPVGRAERVGRWVRRNPGWAAMGGVVAMLLLALAFVGGVSAVWLRKERDSARWAERRAQRQAFEALVSQAKAGRYSRQVGQRFDTLRAVRAAVALLPDLELSPDEMDSRRDELRDLAIAALALPDLRSVEIKDGTGEDAAWVALDHVRFNYYAQTNSLNDLIVRRVDDNREVGRLRGGRKKSRGIFFSHDPRIVYLFDGPEGRLLRWSIDEPSPLLFATIPPVDAYLMRLSPDVRSLVVSALVDKGQRFMAYELPSGRKRSEWTLGAKEILRIDWSRDDKRVLFLYSAGGSMHAEVYDVPTGRRCLDLPLQYGAEARKSYFAATLSPDGRWLAVVNGPYLSRQRNTVQILDVESGKPARELSHESNVFSVAWQPDSTTLAAGLWGSNEIHLWDVPLGQRLRKLREQKEGEPGLFPSPSGQLLASHAQWDGGQVFWHPHTGKLMLRSSEGRSGGSSALPDGRLVLYNRGNGSHRVILTESSPVFRTLVCDRPGEPVKDCWQVALHPRGRLLALGTSDGVWLFDLKTDLKVGRLDVGYNRFVCFDRATGDLLTKGQRGLWRWPVQQVGPTPDALTLGPPRLVSSLTSIDPGFDISPDGRTIAIANHKEGLLLPAAGDRLPVMLRPFDETRSLLFSPDGRWVVSAGHYQKSDNKVWDARTGRLVGPLDAPGLFVADGHWIASSQRRWQTTTTQWQEVSSLPIPNDLYPLAASPEGSYLAYTGRDGLNHIVDAATGHTLARLEPPELDRAWLATFSADGTQLIQSSRNEHAAHVWDLRALREELSKLDLDWNTPPYPPTKEKLARYATPPLQVTVRGDQVTGNLRAYAEQERASALARLKVHPRDADARYWLGYALIVLGKTESAIKELSLALEVRPEHETARLLRGRLAALYRHWDDAFIDADRLVRDRPDVNAARFLRGEASHYLGRHALAVADLTLLPANAASRWSMLELRAASQAALGEKDKARADWTAADALLPKVSSQDLNNTAWRLVTEPASLRDPARALRLIGEALRREPNNFMFWNTQGVAYYRSGKYKEALTALEKSLAGNKDGQEALDLFVMAMCQAKLGAAAKARDCFDRAVQALARQKAPSPNQVAELQAFRAEAEQTLRSP